MKGRFSRFAGPSGATIDSIYIGLLLLQGLRKLPFNSSIANRYQVSDHPGRITHGDGGEPEMRRSCDN